MIVLCNITLLSLQSSPSVLLPPHLLYITRNLSKVLILHLGDWLAAVLSHLLSFCEALIIRCWLAAPLPSAEGRKLQWGQLAGETAIYFNEGFGKHVGDRVHSGLCDSMNVGGLCVWVALFTFCLCDLYIVWQVIWIPGLSSAKTFFFFCWTETMWFYFRKRPAQRTMFP